MKQTKVFHKNKSVMKDRATGINWWVTTKGKVYPTNWKLQCYLVSQQVHKADVQEQLYGKRGKKV